MTDNSIVTTYRAPALNLLPGQSATARIQVAVLNPNGTVRALVSSTEITLE